MRKILLPSIFVLMVVFLVACKSVSTANTPGSATPLVGSTGDAAVDSVGNNLNNVNSVEQDLGTDQLGDLDSGLADVQNI